MPFGLAERRADTLTREAGSVEVVAPVRCSSTFPCVDPLGLESKGRQWLKREKVAAKLGLPLRRARSLRRSRRWRSASTEKLFCVTFLGGVFSAAIALGQLVGPPVLCPGGEVSGADILAMFQNYARNNPQHLVETSPAVTALLAFRSAVGCPK
jgi:hypothetical protein